MKCAWCQKPIRWWQTPKFDPVEGTLGKDPVLATFHILCDEQRMAFPHLAKRVETQRVFSEQHARLAKLREHSKRQQIRSQ